MMSHTAAKNSHRNDDRFPEQGIAAPVTFLVLFVIFVYGALFIALLGIADWCINAWKLTFFLNQGNWGIVMMVIIFLVLWVSIVFALAAIPYFILRSLGSSVKAKKVALIVIFSLFHVFAMPWILWSIIRRNSPTLRKKYNEKLKVMAKGPYMHRRLKERRAHLNKKLHTK